MPAANMTNATACNASDFYYVVTTTSYMPVKLFTSTTRCFINMTFDAAIIAPLVQSMFGLTITAGQPLGSTYM